MAQKAQGEIHMNHPKTEILTEKTVVRSDKSAPMSAAECAEEMAGFDALESNLEEGNALCAAKQAKYDAYRRHRSRE